MYHTQPNPQPSVAPSHSSTILEKISEHRADNLTVLARAAWGNPGAVLKRDRRLGLDYIDITQFYDAFEVLLGPGVRSTRKILVRKEYLTALDQLETNKSYEPGAFVTGHPGIGKTLFLAYALVACLGKRRTVAWELTNRIPYYIIFTDTATFHPVDSARPLDVYGPLLALSDSNDQVQSPSAIFYSFPSRVRTIQTTSPKENCWKEWSKQAGVECYVMDIWSESEITDLAELLNLDVGRMTALAKSWGGVPRRLLRFLGMEDHRVENEYRKAAVHAVQKCRAALSATEEKNIVEEGPSRFYFCRPEQTEFGLDRTLTSAFVPTSNLRCFLGEALRKQDNAIKLNFFRTLSQHSETRAAADHIFESWFHVYISAAKSIQCHWVQGLFGVTRLTGTFTLIPSTWGAVQTSKPPYYWVAPKDRLGIDGALILDNAIYVFQVTVSSKHKTPYGGLQQLRDHLPAELKNFPWRVVFVGDRANAIEAVAQKWVRKLFFPTGQELSIAWSEVDPVMEDTPYRELREESDLDDVSMGDVTE